MLQENPILLQLYRDLVIPQVITSEEFWAQHAAEYTRAKKVQRQEIGVNGAFLVRQFIIILFEIEEYNLFFFFFFGNYKLLFLFDV